MTDQTRTDIAEAIASLTGPVGDEALRLCVIGIGNVLYRHHRRGGDWRELLATHASEFGHAVDWIVSAVKEGDAWLDRKDAKDRPVKLTKLHSVDQLLAEADKSQRRKLQRLGRTTAINDGERVETELADGYCVVRMLSSEALDRESAQMQHCVGLGAYDHVLENDRRALFSLRDPFNKPHATLEVDQQSGIVLQIRGKQNATPVERYLRVLAPFLLKYDLEEGELGRLGIVISSDGGLYSKIAIPDGTRFLGSLRLYSAPPKPRIPASISVEGNLSVGPCYKDIFQLPATITGNVSAVGLKIEGIDAAFVFGKNLSLEGCVVRDFPARHFRGDVILRRTTGVRLRPGTVIDGDLDISHSDIRELPDDIVIRGNLVATGSELQELPAGLAIGGSLYVTATKALREIPHGTHIGGNLMLRGSSVRQIGEDVVVGRVIVLGMIEASDLKVAPDIRVGMGFYLRDQGASSKPSMTVEEFLEATAGDVPVNLSHARRPR